MVAEKAFKYVEKMSGIRVQVPPWHEFKEKREAEVAGELHVEKTRILCKDMPWKHDLYVTVFAPREKADVKGLVIGFHGLGNFGEAEYYYFSTWFARRGYVVVTPDLPYFGHNVGHFKTRGRIGKWKWQMEAMTVSIKWARGYASSYAGNPANGIPWFMVGISMSGLGILFHGLNHFNETNFDPSTIKSCRAIVALVPAIKFLIPISRFMKAVALIISTLFPNYVYLTDPGTDEETGLAAISHDHGSVQWCSPCIEPGSMFGLDGDEASKEYQIDCSPSSPLSTIRKIYIASKQVSESAGRWPEVPIFCTGSSKDDMVDPTGVKEFVDGIENDAIKKKYKLYDGWYHGQLCEEGRELLFDDILNFVEGRD
ncbi:MAG: alpha/beta hydrolase [Promethearchaeota archaeon]